MSLKVGVKGSNVYADAGDPRVTLYTQLVRGTMDHTVRRGFNNIMAMDTDQAITDAVLLTFQTRDVRGGKGERTLFHTLMSELFVNEPELATMLLELVPEYGSWDDMFTMASKCPALKQEIFAVATKQLAEDEKGMMLGKSISLLGKWAPREDKHFKDLAREFAYHLAGPQHGVKHSQLMASYRKRLSRLNASLKTVETYECANRWDEINPAAVPGRARHIKMRAYMNENVKNKQGYHCETLLRKPNDEKRNSCREHFQEFFKAAKEGKVKITGTETLYPHELVKRAVSLGADATDDDKNSINAVWDGMVAKAGGLVDSEVMCDFSGSMQDGDGTPYWVSMAMGLLVASLNGGRLMTFDSQPAWHMFGPEEKTLFQKLDSLTNAGRIGQGLSTDFQKALDLLLATLKASSAKQPPKNLIVVTDMGFDAACGSSEQGYYTGNSYRHVVKTAAWQTHLEMAREAFRRAGEDKWGTPWEPPRIVVWNVAANATDFQSQAETEGVLQLSGWSPSLFKVMCESGPQAQTPMEGLRMLLDDKRYDPVRAKVNQWLNGGWRGT
jgi:hypothetical protein